MGKDILELEMADDAYISKRHIVFALANLQKASYIASSAGINECYPYPDKWPKIYTDDALAEAWADIGSVCTEAKEYKKAYCHYLNALLYSVDCGNAWAGIGSALYFMQEYEEADSFLTMGLGLNPDNKAALYYSALMAMERERYETAIDFFEQYDAIYKENPNRADIFYKIAQCYLQYGTAEPALEAVEKSLSFNPGVKDVWQYKYKLLTALSHDQEAKEVLTFLISKGWLDCNEAELLQIEILCWCYRYEEALASINRSLKITPDNHDLLRYKAIALKGLKNGAELEAVLKLAADHGVVLDDII